MSLRSEFNSHFVMDIPPENKFVKPGINFPRAAFFKKNNHQPGKPEIFAPLNKFSVRPKEC